MTRGNRTRVRERYVPQEWFDQVEKQRLQLQRERAEELPEWEARLLRVRSKPKKEPMSLEALQLHARRAWRRNIFSIIDGLVLKIPSYEVARLWLLWVELERH